MDQAHDIGTIGFVPFGVYIKCDGLSRTYRKAVCIAGDPQHVVLRILHFTALLSLDAVFSEQITQSFEKDRVVCLAPGRISFLGEYDRFAARWRQQCDAVFTAWLGFDNDVLARGWYNPQLIDQADEDSAVNWRRLAGPGRSIKWIGSVLGDDLGAALRVDQVWQDIHAEIVIIDCFERIVLLECGDWDAVCIRFLYHKSLSAIFGVTGVFRVINLLQLKRQHEPV